MRFLDSSFISRFLPTKQQVKLRLRRLVTFIQNFRQNGAVNVQIDSMRLDFILNCINTISLKINDLQLGESNHQNFRYQTFNE